MEFAFAGKTYEYLVHPYNLTWVNERAVEVPVIAGEVADERGRILEIGNVLAHYYELGENHHVIDKYENAPHVHNLDVEEASSLGRFDLIASISTLEHVGFDEPHKEPEKLLRAIEVLRAALTEAGRLIFTIPLGYNPSADRLVKTLPARYLKRISVANTWIEAGAADVDDARYGEPFEAANAVAFVTLTRRA